MRLLLIQPTTKSTDRRPSRSRTRWLMGITPPYLAGLTPKNVVVDLVNDRLEPLPYDRSYDLVWRCFQQFYSLRSIFRRCCGRPTAIFFKDCPAICSSIGPPSGILTVDFY